MILRALWLLLLLPSLSAAQEEPPLVLTVIPETGALQVRMAQPLGGDNVVDALHSGLPVRIRLVVELWRDRFFDSEIGRAEWRATILYEPLEETYRLRTSTGNNEELVVTSIDDARDLLRAPTTAAVRPDQEGRYYYIVNLEVETLSLSDLEELGRWLGGDLGPAVTGEDNVEGAVARGVERLLVRVLGMPTERARARTPTFEVPPIPSPRRKPR